MNINLLKQKKAKALTDAKALMKAAESNEGGVFTAEQDVQFNAFTAEIEAFDKQIAAAEKLAAFERDLSPAAGDDAPSIIGKSVSVGEDPAMEFRSFGDFLQSVADAAITPHKVDARLSYQEKKAAASGLNAGTPSEGGFLIQTQFSDRLLNRAREESVLMPLCADIPVAEGFDGVELPYINETSRATGSRWGGVQVYRNNEAETVSATKPKFGKHEIRLEEMTGIAYATNKLLRNVPALQAVIENAFGSEFGFKIDDEIIRGTGAGQCLGILNANSLLSVPKEVGQAADTIVRANVSKMRSRMPAKNRRNAVWLINGDCEPQLEAMSLDVGTGGTAVWTPANGLSVDPYDRLYSRPILVMEQSSALGDAGDILFCDFSEYVLVTKQGIDAQTSMHVKFLTNENTFRFIMEINGQPVPSSTKAAYKGNSRSAFIGLDAR